MRGEDPSLSTPPPVAKNVVFGHVYVTTPDPDLGYQLRFPDLADEIVSWAATLDEVPVLAEQVIRLWLEDQPRHVAGPGACIRASHGRGACARPVPARRRRRRT
jgi:hypothetical protein